MNRLKKIDSEVNINRRIRRRHRPYEIKGVRSLTGVIPEPEEN